MINAKLVKDLREKTGAGMMDCKKALSQTNGDFEAAIDFLRTKGLASAAKRASKVAAEGVACAVVDGSKAAIFEVNSETDFVARNDAFQSLVNSLSANALGANSIDDLLNSSIGSVSTKEAIVELVAKIGENINLRKFDKIELQDGVIGSYIHNAIQPSFGKIAVLVALESKAQDKVKLGELAKKIAMHIAAARPRVLSSDELDENFLDRERSILIEQTKQSAKNAAIAEKIVEGKLRKLFEEVVLLNQVFVMDNKQKISDVLSASSKELGAEVSIKAFYRYEVGEGIELEEKNFAEEVNAIAR